MIEITTKSLLIAPLFTAILLSGCVNYSPDEKIYFQARSNFRYQSDINNELRVYPDISQPFYGDCEDFAFTLQQQIGGKVWHVKLKNRNHHAVLVKNGMVYDLNYKILRDIYPAQFIQEMQSQWWKQSRK
ncbi:hypothetical protein DI392_00190 [Vibrio albus]|jgi:hypothetical protein|uniref:Lipoprotein n=1 Tax=Vibrio albus TaxID=2200953 RepID=A0A2U3BD74_9VIBR|nr:hypothetical protein [Vibrio albus]PWI34741.1 hypothetical protein DI392_00190 [Vibrio albus]